MGVLALFIDGVLVCSALGLRSKAPKLYGRVCEHLCTQHACTNHHPLLPK